MAQKAQKNTEEASKKEQQLLAGIFESNYATYNGKLHVEGTKLMNEHNEEIQLKGFVLSNIATDINDFKKLEIIKSWGVNVVRFGLNTEEAKDPRKMESLYKVIEICKELDMYCDIVFWNSNQINEHTDVAKEYFTNIVSKYKSSQNLLYEICNEPFVEWSKVATYANEVIPVIREISEDAVIICGTPNTCTNPDFVVKSQLAYNNIMYSMHLYVPNTIGQNRSVYYRNLTSAILKNIPVFITEWSAGSEDGTRLDINEANNLVKLIDKYNLSWCYYNFSGYDIHSYSIIKEAFWFNGNISDEKALTESGIYAKSLLSKTSKENTDLIEDNTLYNPAGYLEFYFWKENYRSKIVNVTFSNDITIPDNCIEVWDISNKGTGNIVAYITDYNGNYKLNIASKDTIYFPEDSSYFFWKFENLENIKFNNIDTSNVKKMEAMFSRCTNLKELDLSKFNTINVTKMRSMFTYTTSIKQLDLSNFSMNKVTDIGYMFMNSGIQQLDLRNANFNASIIDYVFEGSNPRVIVKNQKEKEFILSLKSSLNVDIY